MNQIKGTMAAQNLFSGGISDGGKIAGTIAPGGVFLNDYVLKVSDIEDGHRLTITRGNEVQVMDIIAPETGKSAYDIAVEQGFRGTEAEWVASLKGEDGNDGAPGESGVYIGAEEPTDPNVQVWIDPNGQVDVSDDDFELIETIECDGTYSMVVRTVSLSHAKIYMHIQAAKAAVSMGVEARNAAGLFGYAWLGNAINTGERWIYVYLVSDGKEAYCKHIGPVSSTYGTAGINKTVNRMDASTPINRISIYTLGNSNYLIPAGSTIEIWGVRA